MFKELPETLFYCMLINIFMTMECVALRTYASFRPYNSCSSMRQLMVIENMTGTVTENNFMQSSMTTNANNAFT